MTTQSFLNCSSSLSPANIKGDNKRLDKRNIPKTVNKIYLERKKTYSEADYRIKCGNLKVADIVKKILRMYDDSRN